MAEPIQTPKEPFRRFENKFECPDNFDCGFWYGRISEEMEVCPEIGEKAICEPEGEPYITLGWGSDGSHVNGGVMFPGVQLAWNLWTHAFDCYREAQGGNRLYWRREPTYERLADAPSVGFILSRLYISKGEPSGTSSSP